MIPNGEAGGMSEMTTILTATCDAPADPPDCGVCGHVFEQEDDDLTGLAREALQLAHNGIPVFPCARNRKPLTTNGFKNATSDANQVMAWWKEFPYALPGVPTGRASGFDVLDLDRKNGKDGFESLRLMGINPPVTRTHRTESGAHFLMRAAGLASSAGKIAPGVDVRGEGGYVIWWPATGRSIENPDKLVDVPDWLLEYAASATVNNAPATAPEAAPAQYVDAAVRRDLRSALTALRADDRDVWVRMGHALKTIGEPGRALWLEWSQTSDKWQPADARQWDTFHPTATSYQAVFAEAQRAEWLNPMSNAASTPPSPGAGLAQHQRQHDRGAGVVSGITLTPITADELQRARLTPRVILQELLYSDVRTRISAGGTGKTTVALFEAVTLALGRELWGRTPDRPCRTVIVTREDGREILVARLREICYSLMLDADELARAMENVTILDLSNEPFRLSCVIDDVVYPHAANLDALVAELKPWAPDWVIFDPLVSFGVGEARVNDAEQGLVEAFRIIRNRLDCCVEGIHHSGKANAKEKALDQYAGRGGSAMSDGCRMVCVMQPLDASEWQQATGSPLDAGESGIVMALPKLSYAKSQPSIFVRRNGYRFSMVTPRRQAPEQKAAAQAEQVLQFIRHEYDQGRRYSSTDLEESKAKLNLSRAEIRAAVTALKVAGRVIYHHINGKAGSHYEPVTVAAAGGDGAEDSSLHDDEPSPLDHRRRPIGNEDGGGGAARHSPIVSNPRRDAVATVGDAGDGMQNPPDEIEVEL